MDDESKLSAKIDQATSKSVSLKEDIKQLQAELAELTKSQSEMDKIRQEENEDFLVAQKELTAGLAGVRKALTVLRDYYAEGDAFVQQPAMPETHTKATGAGNGIIGILEVVESDDAIASSRSFGACLWHCRLLHERITACVVVAQDGQCLPHACQTLCQLFLCHQKICVFLLPDLVHL